jgi:very-short-patch-repair endonuclease
MSLSTLPPDAPAVIELRGRPATSPTELVAVVLNELEALAVDLFPAWLPEARGIRQASAAGVAAVRSAALRMGATSQHFGPFLADLATRALTRQLDGPTRFAAEVRATGLVRVIAASYGRSGAALLVRLPDDFPAAAEPGFVAGCEWLASQSGLGVWLTGRSLTEVDRVETMTVRLSEEVAALVDQEPTDPTPEPTGPVVDYPALAGRPHPRSQAEQALETALARCDWAAGRAWNQPHRAGPLANQIRVDLLWEPEKCVVEVDGPEHRGILQYAADRRRDVRLQLHGYAVLRFTNAQILNDIHTVLSQIEQFVRGRRLGTVEGQRHGG